MGKKTGAFRRLRNAPARIAVRLERSSPFLNDRNTLQAPVLKPSEWSAQQPRRRLRYNLRPYYAARWTLSCKFAMDFIELSKGIVSRFQRDKGGTQWGQKLVVIFAAAGL
ncbi:MAG: hypothetical protein A2270_05300 [Elusimicrobia bacterium RIFOXYA12_FULL_51_18]|nr:MAG: hypothetical protein A2270_05300 [Elusimicrobia bacterium RIFOXYA12_FULL_51_18]OGS28758.1 MAG: hypothetical protein A2218_11365 [Elusimicrobia bacterium RIFOXYA2_FULL_53_38]